MSLPLSLQLGIPVLILEGVTFGLATAAAGLAAALIWVTNPFMLAFVLLGLLMMVLSIVFGVQLFRRRRWAVWGGLVMELLITIGFVVAFGYLIFQTAQLGHLGAPAQDLVDAQRRRFVLIGIPFLAVSLVGPGLLWKSRAYKGWHRATTTT